MCFKALTSDNPNAQRDTLDTISLLMLISNIIVVPVTLLSGYLSDKYIKLWHMILFSSASIVLFQMMTLVTDNGFDIWMKIGFVGATTMSINVYVMVRES